jgi:hypothetical protein
MAYCKYKGVKFKPKPNGNKYRFGADKQESLGSIPIVFPSSKGNHELDIDVVSTDIPFLVGLDTLDSLGITADTVMNVLKCPGDEWSLPLVRKLGHVYLEWNDFHDILFTKEQLKRMHLSFYHPSNQSIVNLIKKGRPEQLDQDTLKILEEISNACQVCQRLGPKPVRFKVSIPEEDLVFGDEVSIDLMFLDGSAVLHVVDTATRFSAAGFLDDHGAAYGQSVNGVWLAFIEIWCTMYVGYPNRLRTDSGSIFTTSKWKNLTDMAGITLRISGIEAHNSLGIGERLHGPLRRIYRKVKMTHPDIERNLCLKLTVKSMNDTVGEDGLVPSLLVFGINPRHPVMSTDLPTQKERMDVLATANSEMNSIIAERRIQTALQKAIPAASLNTFDIGDEVLVYREKTDLWEGPYKISALDDKIVTISIKNEAKRFSIHQVKKYIAGNMPSSFPTEIETMLSSMSRGEPMKDTVSKSYISEIIKDGDPRIPMFAEAKTKEIQGLLDRGTFEIVEKGMIPDGANILGGRFVLALKDEGTEQEIWKARFVVQGYRDKMKTSLVHDAATSKQYSSRILVGLAAIFGFRLFSTDVTQAYLQSSEPLRRDVFIKPASDFGLEENKMLKLIRPLYGLADSGDYWGKTLSTHITEDLEMKNTIGDPAFFYENKDGCLQGLIATYVDDLLQAGNTEFQKISESTLTKFQCRDREWDKTQFAGIEIETLTDGFEIHQKRYLSKIKLMAKDGMFSDFRSLRARLAWATLSRPDIACAVAQSAQVNEDTFKDDPKTHIKRLNAVVNHLRKTIHQVLKFPKLDRKNLSLRVYSDASYANNSDGTSQIGYIIFLCDASGSCQPLFWSSKKSKRVTRSVLGSETMALADAFDMAFTIRHDLQNITLLQIPIIILTDSLSLFDVLTKATTTSEKRLMIDLTAAKEAYKKREIDTIGFVRTEYNPADVFTKITRCKILDDILQTSLLNHPVEQWITRTE